MTDLREEAVDVTYTHPEVLDFDGIDQFSVTRYDSATLDPIRKGYAPLGWEGDGRLQMYWDGEASRYVLVRLERDGQYRPVVVSPRFPIINDAEVNQLIGGLVLHDVRRGFDPKSYVDSKNAALDRERTRIEDDEFDNNVVDKLRYALHKDGADNYV